MTSGDPDVDSTQTKIRAQDLEHELALGQKKIRLQDHKIRKLSGQVEAMQDEITRLIEKSKKALATNVDSTPPPPSFATDGYLLLKQQVDPILLDQFDGQLAAMIEPVFRSSPTPPTTIHSALLQNRDLEPWLYSEIRHRPYLLDFCLHHSITGPVCSLTNSPTGLLTKIPLRIDLPLVTRELAVWHQDFHYVRGNQETITAWVPLQDTDYSTGCLMVMPGSHLGGYMDHSRMVLGKRHYPPTAFNSNYLCRYIEMRRGDLLLFHSLLLHSGTINLSPHPRLSIQARYSPLALPTDPAMGELIPLQ